MQLLEVDDVWKIYIAPNVRYLNAFDIWLDQRSALSRALQAGSIMEDSVKSPKFAPFFGLVRFKLHLPGPLLIFYRLALPLQ